MSLVEYQDIGVLWRIRSGCIIQTGIGDELNIVLDTEGVGISLELIDESLVLSDQNDFRIRIASGLETIDDRTHGSGDDESLARSGVGSQHEHTFPACLCIADESCIRKFLGKNVVWNANLSTTEDELASLWVDGRFDVVLRQN